MQLIKLSRYRTTFNIWAHRILYFYWTSSFQFSLSREKKFPYLFILKSGKYGKNNKLKFAFFEGIMAKRFNAKIFSVQCEKNDNSQSRNYLKDIIYDVSILSGNWTHDPSIGKCWACLLRHRKISFTVSSIPFKLSWENFQTKGLHLERVKD